MSVLRSVSLAIMAAVWSLAATAAEHHSQHGAHGHQMTPEQMAELRAKIPLYDAYSDEQIMAGMARMQNLWGWMGDGARSGKIGILGLAHGFKEPGNTQFREAYAAVSSDHPATYALGMAMMSSDHIQSAVTALEEAGAETIVVLPTTTADFSTLTRQWDYIFGRRDESAYLDVPRVEAKADVVWTNTPTQHPIVAEIMLDYAREKSEDPGNETVLIVGHGPQSEEDNARELEILSRHAAFIKERGGFNEVIYGNVQDDAPREVRVANVEKLRADVQRAIARGDRVITVSTALTQSGVVGRLAQDFGDLTTFNDKGLMQHPRFVDWIDTAVTASLAD